MDSTVKKASCCAHARRGVIDPPPACALRELGRGARIEVGHLR
ncbi:MAG: hypothetical protein ABIR98_11235 [Usitatibacter sp.]